MVEYEVSLGVLARVQSQYMLNNTRAQAVRNVVVLSGTKLPLHVVYGHNSRPITATTGLDY